MFSLLITLAVFVDSWKTTLPALIFGMVGIFIVIGVIIIATYALNKLFSKNKNKDKEDDE